MTTQNNNQNKNELTVGAKFMAKLIVVGGQSLPYFNRVEAVLDTAGIARPSKQTFRRLYETLREQKIDKTSILPSRAAEAKQFKTEVPGVVDENDILQAISYLIGKPVKSIEEAKKETLTNILKQMGIN